MKRTADLLAAVLLVLTMSDVTFAQKGKPSQADPVALEFEKAQAAAKQKQWDKAIASYTEALRQDPELVPALVNRGSVFLSMGNVPLAFTDFRKATELSPNLAVAHSWLALALLLQGDQNGAKNAAENALKLEARQSLALYVRGAIRAQRGEAANAIEDLSAASNLHPLPLSSGGKRAVVTQFDKGKGAGPNGLGSVAARQPVKSAEPQAPKSPAQQAAWDRLLQAKRDFDQIDQVIAGRERINQQLSNRRLPPGVPRPPLTPVPGEWLQQRAAALAEWQEATETYKNTK